MIRGFLNGEIVSAEEYLIDYSIRTSQSVHIPTNLLTIPITFNGNDINAFILDVIDDKLVLQLILPSKSIFDDNSNIYRTSYIRKLLNSDEFLSKFNTEFVKHIKLTIVHTGNYTTKDKLWLLSHEEINQSNPFFKTNNNCYSFDLFKHGDLNALDVFKRNGINTDLKSYSRMLLKLNKQDYCGWLLRSACLNISDYVSYVNRYGYVHGGYIYDDAFSGSNLFPACMIS